MPDLFDPDAAAAAVEASRTGRSPITPFTATWPELEEAAAYDVAARVSRLRQVSTGAAPVGRKIGFTNRVMWPLLGVTQPMWGTMYGDTVVLAAGGTSAVDASGFLEPRVEPEIGC